MPRAAPRSLFRYTSRVKVSALRLERCAAGGVRAVADVVWEDSGRPAFELWFEATGAASEDLEPAPEAFVTACYLDAVRHGERRVHVEGRLCPRLAQALTTALALLDSWSGGARASLAIEASNGLRARLPRRPERSAFFLTGGVDSLHLLGTNRAFYPPGHPAAFTEAISLFGHVCAESEVSPWNERVTPALEAAAAESGAGLVAVRTNLWRLARDLPLIVHESLSSALAAAAHLFPRRWSRVSLASGRDVTREIPRGTHPLLDPLYGSSAVEIRHDPCALTRLDRLRALARFCPGLESLVVCMAYPDGAHLNCGRCEKCVRTMTQLLAIGELDRARHFPARDVSAENIRAVSIGPHEAAYWMETLPPLFAVGRIDLVAAIEERLAALRRAELWRSDRGWKGALRRLDRRFLGGRLSRARRGSAA